MPDRFRNLVESIVFAGLKPGIRPSDPLYLTNQTFGQRVRRLFRLAVPLAALIAAGIAAIAIFAPKHRIAARQPSAAEVAARSLPAFDKEIQIDSNRDLQVMEVYFERPGSMAGSLKNVTNRELGEAVVVFDLADQNRSLLGGVTLTQTKLAPGAVRSFKLPVEQTSAMFALVREIRTQ